MSDDTSKKAALLKAICQVSATCGKVAKDDYNKHGAYKFASVDAFLAAVGLPMAEAGLVCEAEQVSAEVITRASTNTGSNGREYTKTSNWERSTWTVSIHHIDGGVFGPVTRIVELPLSGAQTNGSAQSYVQKVVYRSVFNIPTGEPDGYSYAPQESTSAASAATQPSPRASAPKMSREDDRALFSKLQTYARNATTESELTAIYKDNRADIEASKWSKDILAMFGDEKARVQLAETGLDGEVVS